MSDWFKKWFSDRLYLDLYNKRDNDEARIFVNLIQRELPGSASSKVLDICCGAGRHSIELARRGFDVTGFDLSEYLITEAKKTFKKIPEKNLKLKFLNKDMRNFNFRKSFDVAINIFTSFGYFDNDKENFKVFQNCNKSLKSGGWFVFDFINSDYLIKNLVSVSIGKINGKKLVQKRRIENGFVIKDIYVDGKEKPSYSEILRLYSPEDITDAMNITGFKVVKMFGDYYGNKFNKSKSSRLIIFAKKIN